MLGDGLSAVQAWFVNESLTTCVYEKIIKYGDHVIDAGANAGQHTTVMAKLAGPDGRVHAFEPNIHHYKQLLSIPGPVRLWPLAVGDLVKLEKLYIPRGGDGWACLDDLRPELPEYEFEVMTTAQTKIDDLEEIDVDKLSFIKIDVEGRELQVLRGALAAISKIRPTIVFENPTEEIFEFFSKINYSVFHFDGSVWTGTRGMIPNRVAVPTEDQSCLPSRDVVQNTVELSIRQFPNT